MLRWKGRWSDRSKAGGMHTRATSRRAWRTSPSNSLRGVNLSSNTLRLDLHSAMKVNALAVMDTFEALQPSVAGVSNLCANFTLRKIESGDCAHSKAGGML